jgi:hypothetical protein
MSVAEAGSYCNGPLVVSDIPSLRETTGGHAVFVEPQNVDSLKQALDRVYAMSDKERNEMHSNIAQYCSKFSLQKVWEEFSSQLGISIKESTMTEIKVKIMSPRLPTDCYSPLSDIKLEKRTETSEADVHFTFQSNI